MKLRKWWRAFPWDARLGYVTAVGFGAWFSLCVLGGVNLLLFASGCLVYPVLAVIALVMVGGFAVRPPRRSKVIPLLLVCGGLAIPFAAPHAAIDLHVVARVYCAGGPHSLNDWAQGLIREREGRERSPFTETERIPPGVRAHLAGWVSVNGCVRIELGGGFYHYGVIVLPRGKGSPPDRWQRVFGWPPEVVVYHED